MSTNFEKLNSDEKILILMKLSSKEILKVCSVNKDLSRVCNDSRYNPLWYQKIKEDFNITYNQIINKNGYEEYKRLFMLFNTEIYVVSIANKRRAEYYSKTFLSYEDAGAYIVLENNFNPNIYAKLKTHLEYFDSFTYEETTYTISVNYMEKKNLDALENLKKKREEYNKKTESFNDIFNNLEDKNIRTKFNDLLREFIRDTSDNDREYLWYITEVEEFISDYNLQEYEQEIKEYLDYIL